MIEKESISSSFIDFSVILFILAFVLTLLNMLFSISSNKRNKKYYAFKYIELINYKKPINYSFLMDLNFSPDFESSDDYGSIGTIKDIWFLGTCTINFKKKTTYNCSLACLDKIENCTEGENPCKNKECREYFWRDEKKACHEFNRKNIGEILKFKKI